MIQCAVSLIVANLAVVVTHIYRLLRNGEDVDHASYDASAINTTRLGIGGLKNLFSAKRARYKSHASSMHFSRGPNPQTRVDPQTTDTTMDTETQPTSKTYHPLTFTSDMSDDRGLDQDEKQVGTWSRNDQEAGNPSNDTGILVTQTTTTSAEPA
jgi:hypothetical protein